MAEQKLSERNPLQTSASADFIHIVHNGVSYRHSKSNLQKELQSQIDGLASGFVGGLSIADTPTEDGLYIASESGTYTNAGNLVVDLTTYLTFISVTDSQSTFTKTEVPLLINDNGFVRTSSFNINSSNTGAVNFTNLTTLIASYDKIIVDEFCDLDISGTEIQLGTDFEMKGINGGGFNLTTSGTLFKGNNNANTFKLSDLKFTASLLLASNESRIFRMSLDDYCEFLEVKDCYFEGYIEAIYCIQTGEYNPEVTQHGFDKIIIKNNVGHELIGQLVFIRDYPANLEIVEGNIITNLNCVFYQSIVEGTRTYIDEIIEARKSIIINNNKVVNEVGHNPTDIDGSYLALAVIENLNVEYTNNHVENLRHDLERAIYDAYLSSVNVVYSGNVWKNNTGFHATYTENRHLLKSKGNPLSTNDLPLRIYTNNSWIIEDDYLDAIGKTSSDTWNRFIDIADESRFVFKDNYVNIKGLHYENIQSVSDFDISNNTLLFDYVKGGSNDLFYFDFNGVTNSKDSYIINNNIQFLSNPLTKSIPILSSELSSSYDKTIHFKGNTIKCENGSISSIINAININGLIFTDNSIETDYTTLFYNCWFDKFHMFNNQLRTDYTNNDYPAYGQGFVKSEGFIEQGSYNDGDINLPINDEPATDTSTLYRYELSFEDENGTDIITFEYTCYDVAGVKKITFTKTDDSTFDELFNAGSNTAIKHVRTGDYDSGIYPYYVKHPTIPYILISSEPSTIMYKTIKLKTFN
jgi:hypothetical protein